MSEDKLQKKVPEAIKEKTQYALAFGVIATMLFVAGFPMFIIIFFAIFAYFLWKTFASPSPNGTREVFEFYLSANEILRDDERRWFGFEVQETIGRGERILQMMNGAPPLVYFTLGALYHKVGDHKSAVNHLAYILENDNADEKTYLYASPELKNYTKILRKIEREPAEAPQTSAAIRALERARRNRGKTILEESRKVVKESNQKKREAVSEQKKNILAENNGTKKIPASITEAEISPEENGQVQQSTENSQVQVQSAAPKANGAAAKSEKNKRETVTHRPPISELLRDIYDDK
jgi:tetratricopeptide (TPR) repeat protein